MQVSLRGKQCANFLRNVYCSFPFLYNLKDKCHGRSYSPTISGDTGSRRCFYLWDSSFRISLWVLGWRWHKIWTSLTGINRRVLISCDIKVVLWLRFCMKISWKDWVLSVPTIDMFGRLNYVRPPILHLFQNFSSSRLSEILIFWPRFNSLRFLTPRSRS